MSSSNGRAVEAPMSHSLTDAPCHLMGKKDKCFFVVVEIFVSLMINTIEHFSFSLSFSLFFWSFLFLPSGISFIFCMHTYKHT